MRKNHGFTLIEILVALMVFAILATITSSSLYYAFNIRTRVSIQAERLNSLQLANSIMQQDTAQISDRAPRGNEMRLFPAFIGRTEYVEFTRSGYTNPQSMEKRSTLTRVGYVCSKDKLFRRTWITLDTVNRNVYQDKLLLDNLSDCHFNYLDQSLHLLAEWREASIGPGQTDQQAPLPKAIQINLTLNDWGEMNQLFIITEALYAPNK